MELVHERLDAAGVTHTLVKGAAWAIRWFEKPTHRPYSDIDSRCRAEPLWATIRALNDSHPVLSSLNSRAAQSVSAVEMTLGGVRAALRLETG